MDFLDYEIEDFIQDHSFRSYCLGLNEEDQAFWENWVVLHPEKYGKLQQARLFLEMLNGNNTATQFRKDLESFQASLDLHLAAADPKAGMLSSDLTPDIRTGPASGRKFKVGYAVAIAASIAGVLFFTAVKIGPPAHTGKSQPDEYARISNAGERKSFQLPDGTKVMLNAGSQIHIPSDFNIKTREIVLEGEAFFDVAKDPQKPLVIHTTFMDIKVLGTSFNVKAYAGDKTVEASLLSGAIEVDVKKGGRKILLRPSEKIVLFASADPSAADSALNKGANSLPQDYTVRSLAFNPADSSLAEVSWTENRLVFSNSSFGEIALALERWYNVSIQFEDPSLKEFRFTATFDKKTMEQVLEALSASRPFEFRQQPGNKPVYKISTMKN